MRVTAELLFWVGQQAVNLRLFSKLYRQATFNQQQSFSTNKKIAPEGASID